MVEVVASPGPLFTLAAFCAADFGELLSRARAEPIKSSVTSFGQFIDSSQTFFLRIGPERYAVLSKYASKSEFEIGLQILGSTFYSHELSLVREFIGCTSDAIRLYRNPPIRWAEDRPSESDLRRWLTRIGSPYPY